MKNIYLCIAMFFLSASVNASSLEEMILNQDAIVGGKPVSEYVNIWWQWTYTMPKELSPVVDTNGQNCHVGQSGEVWFLAGGYGSSTIRRKCELPSNKYIFFPIINMVYYPRGDSQVSCDAVKKSAALNNDALLSIEVELDGMIVRDPVHTRMSSRECFDLLGMIPKEKHPLKVFPSASDGFWIMLKPLSKGKHILKFNAMYGRKNGVYGKMAQDIEYELNIK